MLNVITLNVITLNVITLSVIMLSVIMLSVVMLSVILQNVMAHVYGLTPLVYTNFRIQVVFKLSYLAKGPQLKFDLYTKRLLF